MCAQEGIGQAVDAHRRLGPIEVAAVRRAAGTVGAEAAVDEGVEPLSGLRARGAVEPDAHERALDLEGDRRLVCTHGAAQR